MAEGPEGSTGGSELKRGPGADPDNAAIRFPPPLAYLGGFVAGAIVEQVAPAPDPPRAAAAVAGFLIVVLALTLSSASVSRFRAASTSVVPNRPAKALVTSGPYRFSRNPMYVALAIAYVGSALIVRMLWPLVVLPLVIVIIHRYVVLKEERYLERTFGEGYLRYKATVRRWL